MSGIDISEISKGGYYFKLPSTRVMATVYLALQLVSSFILTGDPITALFMSAAFFSLAFTSSHLLFRATREFSASKPSRFFGIFLLQASVSTLSQVMAVLLSPLSKAISLFVLISGCFCLSFLLVSLSEVFAGRTLFSLLIWAVSTGNILLYASRSIEPLVLFYLAVCSFSGALCFLLYVNSSSLSNRIPKPTKMFRPYLEYKLGGRGESLEALLKSTSKRSKVKLTAVCFERDSQPLFMVNSGVHFGPFDGIGSSSLPSDAFCAFRDELGAVALFTHPFSSHEKDIPSKEDAKRVLYESLEALREHSRNPPVRMTPFFRSSRGAFDIWVALCGDTAICVASSKDPTVDDLPENALEGLLREGESLGVSNLYDVDAHSNISLPPPNRPSGARYEDLIEGYREALNRALVSSKFSMRIGYANVPLDGRQDVGPLGVSALVFDFGTSRQALIIIDGNNMVEGLAQRIANRVKQVGIQEVLVVTNDNHILTGIFNVEGGYYPVGARDGDLVVESSAQAVERAVHDLSRCEIRVVTAEVNDVPLLGDGLSVLLGVTIKALQRFKRSLVAYLLYSFLLSALGTSFSVG